MGAGLAPDNWAQLLSIEQWDEYKAKKSLFFSLRYLEHCTQIIQNGLVLDRSASLTAKAMLVNVQPSDCWASHLEVFIPLREKALGALEAALWKAGLIKLASN